MYVARPEQGVDNSFPETYADKASYIVSIIIM